MLSLFSVALRPQSPGRSPRLLHSSWTLTRFHYLSLYRQIRRTLYEGNRIRLKETEYVQSEGNRMYAKWKTQNMCRMKETLSLKYIYIYEQSEINRKSAQWRKHNMSRVDTEYVQSEWRKQKMYRASEGNRIYAEWRTPEYVQSEWRKQNMCRASEGNRICAERVKETEYVLSEGNRTRVKDTEYMQSEGHRNVSSDGRPLILT